MTMPNFLIIGAAKAGTTSLHSFLAQHPQIYLSPVKEPNFFALEGEKLDFPEGTISPGYLAQCKTDLKAYQEQFQAATNQKATGEASPLYLYASQAPQRIKSYLPDVKLIAILRNPVERAYSNFLHHIREGFETYTDFGEALKAEEERIQEKWWWGFYYLQGGFYYQQLQRYFQIFDPQQIRIYLYEDLKTQPVELLQDIFQFLGVDSKFIPDTSAQYNVGGVPKNQTWYRFLTTKNPLKEPFKLLFPASLRKSLVLKLKNKALAKPQLSSGIQAQLREAYREDIFKLQDLIGRDLSSWLEQEE